MAKSARRHAAYMTVMVLCYAGTQASPAAAQDARVTLRVRNDAQVPGVLLADAKARVNAIYAKAGIDVTFVDAGADLTIVLLSRHVADNMRQTSGCARVRAIGSRTHRVCRSTARRQARGRLPRLTGDCARSSDGSRNGPSADARRPLDHGHHASGMESSRLPTGWPRQPAIYAGASRCNVCPTDEPTGYFNAPAQLRTTVIGGGASSSGLMTTRNR